MAKIDAVQLEKELSAGRVRPLYLIVGNESYLAHNALKSLERVVLRESSSELGRVVIDGKDFSFHNFSDHLNSLPMFGEKSLVVVNNTDKISKDDLDKLIDSFEKQKSSSVAAFVATKLDGRSRFMQVLTKHTLYAVVECKPLYSNQVPAWVGMEVRSHGKQISQQAAAYLSDMVGTDLGQLSETIQKVVLFVGKNPLIELTDVESAVAETTQRSIFELTDAIGQKNKSHSLSILKNLLDNGVQPVLILSMVARHFRILVKAKEIEGRASSSEAASYLGVNSFFVRNYLSQSGNYTAKELNHKIKMLSLCDREIKSSRIPKERILEKLIL